MKSVRKVKDVPYVLQKSRKCEIWICLFPKFHSIFLGKSCLLLVENANSQTETIKII